MSYRSPLWARRAPRLGNRCGDATVENVRERSWTVAAFVASFALAVVAPAPFATALPAANRFYEPIIPTRDLDTRVAFGVATSARTTVGVPVEVSLGPVPGDAEAVTLNVTITEPTAAGFATIYACGSTRPLASNLNFVAGATVPNLVIARVGDGDKVCIVTSASAHVIADVQGWFPTGSYQPEPTPRRVLDTRQGAAVRLMAGRETPITPTTGSAGNSAIVANVTVTEPTTSGFVTVYPCGSPPPFTSNLNFTAGQTVANLVVARSGVRGQVCARASTSTHLVVDVQGVIPEGAGYTPISPVRMVDTRAPIGVATQARVAPNQVTELLFPITSGIDSGAQAAIMNVTVTDPVGAGFLTVFPCGTPRPVASNLNFVAGETRPNLVISGVGGNGRVCIIASTAAHVVVDLQGWFVGTPNTDPNTAPVSAKYRERVDRQSPEILGHVAFLPVGYASNPGRTWPTIVFLHGSGEAGSGVGAELDVVDDAGLGNLVDHGIEPLTARGFVVLAPQFPGIFANSTANPALLHQWLAVTMPKYRIDRDRMYLTGLSLGGYTTFDYLAAYGDSNEFAAMIPIAGARVAPIVCSAWRRTPLWAFHGEADVVVDVSGSIGAVITVNDTCSPVEQHRLTTYPNVGHNSWDRTYDLTGMRTGQTNPAYFPYDVDIYTWMLAHTRSTYR